MAEIKEKVGDFDFRKICNIMSDFCTGRRVLHHAAEMGHLQICEFLIENAGFHIDVLTDREDSPLMLAVKSRSFECMELLLKVGCVYFGCMENEGKEKIGKEKGANPSQILYGLNRLAHAAKEGDTRYLERLIEAGADPKLLISAGLLEPIEHAAMANNLEGVEILFPRTERISRYTNWSVDGIVTYCHSEETKIEAIVVEPSNPKWLANQSLCFMRMGRGVPALCDAEECVRLSPGWAKAHYREGSAWMLFKNYDMAARAFAEAY